MEKKTKNSLITWGIILGVIIIAIVIIYWPSGKTSEEIAICIGENSVLYTQTGCIHCIQQVALFGENEKYLNEFNCLDDNWKICTEKRISGTPTWEIDGKLYPGKRSIEMIQNLTGC